MSKPIKLILALSIAANAILFAGFATGILSFSSKKAPGDVSQRAGAGSALSPEAAKEAVALFTADDSAALRDRLRGLGLPDATVREIVKARIASRHTARLREIGNAALEAARQQPYWRRKPDFVGGMLQHYTPEQQKEMDAISREMMSESRRVLGAGESSGYGQIHYAFLPLDKVAQLQEMERDYRDLRNQTINEMAGFRMPGDEAKLKLLEEESKRDMEAVLSPEERMENDLRNSRTAWGVQRAFAGFGGTEEEYKAIFALQHALEEKYPSGTTYDASTFGGVDQSEFYRARAEEQKNIDAQIKDMLGDERYAEYVRGQRQDYQSLQAAAERFNLGAETVAHTYQVREVTAVEAKRISDDKNLDAGQKAEAYAALTEQATAQIRAALGDDVGDAYINNALSWLRNLPKGGNVTIDERGNVRVSQPRPAPPARGQGGG